MGLPSHFQQLLPAEFLHQALAQANVKSNNSVYSPLVVLWLLVAQRLQCGTSMEAAVLELLHGLPASFWPRPCKRILDWREQGKAPSSHTGAYNQARQALPLSVVQKSCDHIFEQLVAQIGQPASDTAIPTFLLDGSTMRVPHTPELCSVYPPSANQYGQAHWPLLRVVVAHDLQTGLAMRPEWGPMHGDQAISEQALLERAIDRLPPRAVAIGDANFGVFSVAYASTQRQHPVVLRLTAERARCLAGEELHHGIDRALVWRPSRSDRKSHPAMPTDACVPGRLQVRQVQPDDGSKPFLLALFTTLSSAEDAFQFYGKRWNIETDLRTLKSTLCLDQLTCLTPDMVAKEIDLGFVAYNLVRAFIGFASQLSGIPPRGYSFTKVRRILEVFGPDLANAPDQQSTAQVMDQIMRIIQQSKLPRRKRKRPSYPREVFSRGSRYPSRKK
ncbi:MAG TPA: IS4 family transposase [Candidatus Solibacter sp.]